MTFQTHESFANMSRSPSQASVPVVGAAMTVAEIESHRDWMLDKDRDLELQSFITAETLNGDWRPQADRAKRLLDGFKGRLGVHGPFWGFTVSSADPDVRAVVSRRFEQALDVCSYIGATHMVVHSPFTTWSYNNFDNLPGEREKIVEYTHLTLSGAVRRAEDMGSVLVMENIEDKNPHDRVQLVRAFNSRAIAVSIDTGHAHYAHCSTGGPPVDYYLKAAGDLLQHLHLQDSDGYADRHWALGEGTVNWRAVFSAHAQCGAKPRLIIEIRDKSRIRASANFLASLGLAQ